MKTLKQLLEKTDKAEPTAPIEPDSVTSYVPKSKDEKRFMDKHVVKKTDDVNGNGDDVFRGTNIKAYDRSATRHGYNTKEDQKVYESKTLSQILGEKTLSSAEMKKREEIAQAMERDNPGMDKSKKMAIATATAKRVAEGAEQTDEAMSHQAQTTMKHVSNPTAGEKKAAKDIKPGIKGYRDRVAMLHSADAEGRLKKEETELDEAVRHDQYSTYHAGVKDMLKKLGAAADAHKEAAMSPTDYNKEKGANMHSGHVYTMKNMHRTLQDLHDQLQGEVEYAQQPKPMRMKEETDLFSCFDEETRKQVEQVYEHLDDDNKQIVIEMIEAEEYDELVSIVNEVLNG